MGLQKETTLVFDESVDGFPTFLTRVPDYGVSLNNRFITFKKNKAYEEHRQDGQRGRFYGNGQGASSVTAVFNDDRSSIKNFKSMSYEGSKGWEVSYSSDQESTIVDDTVIPSQRSETGNISSADWSNKEGKYFREIKNSTKVINPSGLKQGFDLKSNSIAGIGLGSYFDTTTNSIVTSPVSGTGFVDGGVRYDSYLFDSGDLIAANFLISDTSTLAVGDAVTARYFHIRSEEDGTIVRDLTITEPIILENLIIAAVQTGGILNGRSAFVYLPRGLADQIIELSIPSAQFDDILTDSDMEAITDNTDDVITTEGGRNYFYAALQLEVFDSPQDPLEEVRLVASSTGDLEVGDELLFFRGNNDGSLSPDVRIAGTVGYVTDNRVGFKRPRFVDSYSLPSGDGQDFFIYSKDANVESSGILGFFLEATFSITSNDMAELFSGNTEYFISST